MHSEAIWQRAVLLAGQQRWDLAGKELQIWATSRGVVEEITEALEAELEVRLIPRVPASFVDADTLDQLAPTTELFGDELSSPRKEGAV